METNPFSVPSQISEERGVFGDAKRLKGGFLYRVIEFEAPFPLQLVYDGWWFRQTVDLNGIRAWSQISWLNIQREVEFAVPSSVSPACGSIRIEINFGRTLFIRRFRVWIDELMVYDEIS